ncbi:MAG: PilT/PilU family type 4a pilus ATPase [Candidatus Dojkabacteria bacterium]|nr:PilT/PilU family type 4a pilus ATPase [Candidatus Dojkabacteria bacterium]MDQ7020463.1 PilT/PilU family type 4a pilus ATPase [Candidatus Dojkabacteria bacterium]
MPLIDLEEKNKTDFNRQDKDVTIDNNPNQSENTMEQNTNNQQNQNAGVPQQDISEKLPEKLQGISENKPVYPSSNSTQQNSNVQVDLNMQQYTIQDLFSQAIKYKASDIHLGEGYRAIIRVDGSLKTVSSGILTAELLLSYVKKLLKDRNDVVIENIKQLDLGYDFGKRRFRVNIYKTMGSFSIVARLIPEKILTVDELGLPPVFKTLGDIANGLVLVTGPTGSGKTTTIASIFNHINSTKAHHLITLEDPIEFIFPRAMSLVDQRELGNDFDDWTGALKSLLRQDPDVVLVGEMRDLPTISSTITVAETGHLVFATLHTNSASQSIDRIIDVFPEEQQSQVRAQLANVIVAVIAQRLVPLNSGGRKAVIEFMIGNSAIKNAIREGKTYQIDNMIQTGQEAGMISMEKTLAQLVKSGQITSEVAKATTTKPSELDLYLKK